MKAKAEMVRAAVPAAKMAKAALAKMVQARMVTDRVPARAAMATKTARVAARNWPA